MNPAETNGWNRSQRLTLGVLLFLGHLAIMRWWVKAPPIPPALGAVMPVGRWVDGGLSGLAIRSIHPRIVGLDGDWGFSAAARQILPRTAYESPERKVSAPPSLSATTAGLGQTSTGPLVRREIPEPAVALLDEPSVPRTPIPSQSVIELSGEFSSRAWQRPPIVAPWIRREVPGPVLLQVAISPAGYIVLVSVQESSGFPDADREAVLGVRKARLQPEMEADKDLSGSADRLRWGSIRVRWSIGPLPPATR